jgi:hypothetical protein
LRQAEEIIETSRVDQHGNSPFDLDPPQVCGPRDLTSSPGNQCTPGTNQGEEDDLVVEDESGSSEEDYIEEIFGQLWAIPDLERARVTGPWSHGGCLVWIRNDVLRERKIHLEDCYPLSRLQKFDLMSRTLSFSWDISSGSGVRATLAEIVKRKSMAEGGR